MDFYNEERKEFNKAQRDRILSVFQDKPEEDPTKTALAITKAEFEEKFPLDKFEVYSVKLLHNFRKEILKAEDVEDKDAAFKQATANLKPYIIHDGDNRLVVFVRGKEKGE